MFYFYKVHTFAHHLDNICKHNISMDNHECIFTFFYSFHLTISFFIFLSPLVWLHFSVSSFFTYCKKSVQPGCVCAGRDIMRCVCYCHSWIYSGSDRALWEVVPCCVVYLGLDVVLSCPQTHPSLPH